MIVRFFHPFVPSAVILGYLVYCFSWIALFYLFVSLSVSSASEDPYLGEVILEGLTSFFAYFFGFCICAKLSNEFYVFNIFFLFFNSVLIDLMFDYVSFFSIEFYIGLIFPAIAAGLSILIFNRLSRSSKRIIVEAVE